MSGIVGIFRSTGAPVSAETVGRLSKQLAHRGPDGEGTWAGKRVGFGHQLLQTTPESIHESLPEVTADGLAITADARIDNRVELLSELGPLEGSPAPVTDSRLILEAFREWGEECPEKLLGAFAFAIWDGRNERVFCARDHMGVKPFYYHHRNALFAFASEPKALLEIDGVSSTLDEERIGEYLISLHEDTVRTFYEPIQRLPPAHTATVDASGISTREYWSLDPNRTIILDSDEAYAARFRELFTDAVQCRLRSAFPVGSLLSGGLDSSSIACSAREALDDSESLHTFSGVFDKVTECDESPYIEAVLDSGDFTSHYIHPDEISPLVDLERILFHQDEPVAAPNHFMHWSLYDAASDHGVRVLLDGIDGDTTLSHGRGYLAQLARTGRWIQLSRELTGFSRNFNRPPHRVLFNRVLAPLAPTRIRNVWRWMFRDADHGPALNENPTIDHAFSERINLDARVRELVPGFNAGPATPREQHYRQLTSGLNALTFERADKSAAAHGLEPRYPFFDKRLVEFCLALPTEQKIRRGWTRIVLRRAMEGTLPRKVRWRGGKADLSSNFYRGLKRYERERLDSVVIDDPSNIEPYLDIEELRDAYSRYLSNGNRDGLLVWRGVMLDSWLDRT